MTAYHGGSTGLGNEISSVRALKQWGNTNMSELKCLHVVMKQGSDTKEPPPPPSTVFPVGTIKTPKQQKIKCRCLRMLEKEKSEKVCRRNRSHVRFIIYCNMEILHGGRRPVASFLSGTQTLDTPHLHLATPTKLHIRACVQTSKRKRTIRVKTEKRQKQKLFYFKYITAIKPEKQNPQQ